MQIESFKTTNFRIFSEIELQISAPFTFITGNNGTGKTSLLEAIFYLMTGRSFKRVQRKEMVKKGSNLFFIEGTFANSEIDYTVKSSYQQNPHENRISLNQIRLKSYRELIELFPVVPFLLEDNRILSESPGLRRNFFDRLIAYTDIRYYDLLLQYQVVLKNRNELLKTKMTVNLEFWDEKLAALSERIIQERHQYISDFNKMLAEKAYLPVGVSDFKVYYRNEMTREIMLKKLQEQRSREQMLGFTLLGPHRDDFDFRYSLGAVKKYASAGQLKTLAFFLKMIQAIFIAKKRKLKPILLIDDIFAELDEKNRKNVLSTIKEAGFQTFLTAVELQELLPSFHELHYQIIDLNEDDGNGCYKNF